MAPELDEVWNRTLDRVRRDILRPSFETWLKSSHAIRLDRGSNCLIVGVPHEFAKHWVQENYAQALEKALTEVMGSDVSLSLVVSEDGETAASADTEYTSIDISPDKRKKLGRDSQDAESMTRSALNSKYTFSNFVVGNSNRLAHAASMAVAEAPSRAYNPLFIYGGVGLGKTHLMQAIAHRVLEERSATNVVYVSTERFANELINSIRDTQTVGFRNRYRNVEVLLIDDIQFLAGKERTQEEFFHTFNTLYEANRQIVISSDRPPKEIPTLEERLRSRFEWGLISDIQPPDLETRIAILRKNAASENLNVPDAVLRYIAEHITSNIRELEGALIRLVAFSSLHQQAIGMELAEKALHDLIPKQMVKPLTIDSIMDTVSERYDTSLSEMKGKRRTRAVVFPRQIAMYLCRELTDASLPQIGTAFGGRDHSTVIHACRKISGQMQEDAQLKAMISDIIRQLQREG